MVGIDEIAFVFYAWKIAVLAYTNNRLSILETSSSSVTSLPSDGIPTTLNYVCREATRDDPTSDTKSEIDQTEVTDVQSVTTVPMKPPLITQNDETKTTYVDYVRESIVSLWKQKEPAQGNQVESGQITNQNTDM